MIKRTTMENKEAIHILNEVKQMDDSMYAYNPAYMEALNLAISALENEDWIKCSERQPEESDLYLVTVDEDYFPENCSQVDFLYWDSEAKEWKFVYEEYKLEKFDAPVIAWKTRPEPYKERVMDGD
jgi:hypothetical protein